MCVRARLSTLTAMRTAVTLLVSAGMERKSYAGAAYEPDEHMSEQRANSMPPGNGVLQFGSPSGVQRRTQIAPRRKIVYGASAPRLQLGLQALPRASYHTATAAPPE